MEITIERLKELIKEIESEYNVEPNEDNEGDCLNAKDGYELLIKRIIKNCA
jgi:hypothetical protein